MPFQWARHDAADHRLITLTKIKTGSPFYSMAEIAKGREHWCAQGVAMSITLMIARRAD
jgi:hypothetical protein